jgi:hypothetical protein
MTRRLAWWLICIACAWATAPAAADPGAPQPGAEAPGQVLVLINLPAPHFRAEGNYSGGYTDFARSAARRRIAGSLARAHGLTLATHWAMPVLGVDCYVIDVPASQDPAAIARALGRDPRVAWTQPMNTFRGLSDDPLFKLQPAAGAWRLDDLHAVATGRHVRVAIIDSGVEADHPDLRGQVALNLNLVTDGPPVAEDHGTAVAGIVVAVADNRVGIVGVAPQARLLALRACRQAETQTLCDTLGLARALDAAIGQHAQVINLSLSGPPDRLVQRLVEAALTRGIIVVAAVDRTSRTGGFPASLDGVIAVSDRSGSDSSPHASIAPGTDIPTTLGGSRWALVSGASYSTAHVSGLVALLLDAQARRGAPSALTAGDLVRQPNGQLDACASLARAAAACACRCDGPPSMASTAKH